MGFIFSLCDPHPANAWLTLSWFHGVPVEQLHHRHVDFALAHSVSTGHFARKNDNLRTLEVGCGKPPKAVCYSEIALR